MRTMLFLFGFVLCLLPLVTFGFIPEMYDEPSGDLAGSGLRRSESFSVWVDGDAGFVYEVGEGAGSVSWLAFAEEEFEPPEDDTGFDDFEDEEEDPARLEVRWEGEGIVERCLLRPIRAGVHCVVLNETTVSFSVHHSFDQLALSLFVEPVGAFAPSTTLPPSHPTLLLFADPPQAPAPSPLATDTLWFPKGVHRLPGLVPLPPGMDKVFVAPGAVLFGGGIVSERGVHVYGGGVLAGGEGHRDGTLLQLGSGSVVEGVVLVGGAGVHSFLSIPHGNTSIFNVKFIASHLGESIICPGPNPKFRLNFVDVYSPQGVFFGSSCPTPQNSSQTQLHQTPPLPVPPPLSTSKTKPKGTKPPIRDLIVWQRGMEAAEGQQWWVGREGMRRVDVVRAEGSEWCFGREGEGEEGGGTEVQGEEFCGDVVRMVEGDEGVEEMWRHVSVSRVHATVNEELGREHWDYWLPRLQWSDIGRYSLGEELGSGTHSVVYRGRDVEKGRDVAIKVLKSLKKRKVRRETHILRQLHALGVPHVIGLLDVARNESSKFPWLVFELVNVTSRKVLHPTLNISAIRFMTRHVLETLAGAHAAGVVHRDIKPGNIAFDPESGVVRVLDWGLSTFYHPRRLYDTHVASLHYKGPELLVDLRDYDYSLDIWSLGAMVAGMIFRSEPFFDGEDNLDQLVQITSVLGSDELLQYIEQYKLNADRILPLLHGRMEPVPFHSLVNDDNRHLATPLAIDFVQKCLKLDHHKRITATEALQHPWILEE